MFLNPFHVCVNPCELLIDLNNVLQPLIHNPDLRCLTSHLPATPGDFRPVLLTECNVKVITQTRQYQNTVCNSFFDPAFLCDVTVMGRHK
jgi:hypothetical protein